MAMATPTTTEANEAGERQAGMPHLMLPAAAAAAAQATRERSFYSPIDGRWLSLRVPPGITSCYASAHGWLLLGIVFPGSTSGYLYLLDPVYRTVVHLPPWLPGTGIPHFALSGPATDPDFVVSAVVSAGIVYWRHGDADWQVETNSKYEELYINPNLSDYVHHSGKFYFLHPGTAHMVVVIIEPDGVSETLLEMGGGEEVPPAPGWYCDLRFLVGSGRELLLVAPSVTWSECRVFRADFGRMAWRAVDRLGRRMLFLGKGCSAAVEVNSDVLGSRVYFSHPELWEDSERGPGGFGRRWFWAMLSLGCGPAIKYVPQGQTAEETELEACHWFIPYLSRQRTHVV